MKEMDYAIYDFVGYRENIAVNIIHYSGYNVAINEVSLLNESLP